MMTFTTRRYTERRYATLGTILAVLVCHVAPGPVADGQVEAAAVFTE